MQLSDGSAVNGGAVEAAARAVQASLRLQSDTLVGVPGRCVLRGVARGQSPAGARQSGDRGWGEASNSIHCFLRDENR